MPCFLILLALALPRGVILGLWLLSDWFSGVFGSFLWPVVGFFFLPTTLLWYSAVQHWFGGEWGLWPIIGLLVALAIDTSPGHGRRQA